VEVDIEQFRQVVAVHQVSVGELAQVEVTLVEPGLIDPGEKELLAHAVGKPGIWHVSASDRGAVFAGHELGLLDRFVSLEALVRVLGLQPQLKNHFTEKWLSALRTDILLGGTQ
jgi:hypothetical protein